MWAGFISGIRPRSNLMERHWTRAGREVTSSSTQTEATFCRRGGLCFALISVLNRLRGHFNITDFEQRRDFMEMLVSFFRLAFESELAEQVRRQVN